MAKPAPFTHPMSSNTRESLILHSPGTRPHKALNTRSGAADNPCHASLAVNDNNIMTAEESEIFVVAHAVYELDL